MTRPIIRRCHHRPAAILAIALFGLALMPAGMAQGERNPDEIRATARRVLADGYYQHQSPGQREAEAPAAESENAGTADPHGTEEAPPGLAVDRRASSAAAQVGTAFLWVMAIVAGLLFAFQSVRLLRNRFGPRSSNAVRPAAVRAHPTESEEPPLAAADRLAKAGLNGEGVRRLLLAALEQLRRQLGGTVAAPSLTAREVMHTPMPARARAALSIMLESEERGRFGGRLVDQASYRACRACYLRFTTWLGTGVA